MKCLFTFATVLFCTWAQSQTYIQPRSLQVASNKTTNLVFPAPIQSIDRGTERIIVQQSTGFVLKVKADTAFSDTTNLTVITTDGKLYSFLVSYTTSPAALNIDLGAADMPDRDTAMVALSEKVLKARNYLHGVRYSSGKVRLSITGIYSTGELVIYKLRIENSSSFSFITDRIRFYTSNSHVIKRTPSQIIEVIPLHIHPALPIVKEKQVVVIAAVLPKAALGISRIVQIDVGEQDGGRQLFIHSTARQLHNSILIR